MGAVTERNRGILGAEKKAPNLASRSEKASYINELGRRVGGFELIRQMRVKKAFWTALKAKRPKTKKVHEMFPAETK